MTKFRENLVKWQFQWNTIMIIFIFNCVNNLFVKKIINQMSSVLRQNSQRKPLRQISQNLPQNPNTQHKRNGSITIVTKQNQLQVGSVLKGKDMERLKQLKHKYSLGIQKQVLPSKQIEASQCPSEEFSFNKIHLQSSISNKRNFQQIDFRKTNNKTQQKDINQYDHQTNHKHLCKDSSLSVYRQDFHQKIQKFDSKLEEDFENIQKKLLQLRQKRRRIVQMPQTKQIQIKAEKSLIKIQRQEPKSLRFIQSVCTQKQQSIGDKNIKSQKSIAKEQRKKLNEGYAHHLKNKNFIEEIKRKIQMIENDRKMNVSKCLSKTSDQNSINIIQLSMSKETCEKRRNQQSHLDVQNQKLTLAELTPNLAQSQIIELTDRQVRTQRNRDKAKESLVVKEYKFEKGFEKNIDSKNLQNKFNLQKQLIIEQKQYQDQCWMASPALTKSHFQQKNLGDTQIVECKQLQGDFSGIEEKTLMEFMLLINRMAHQVQVDNDFATLIFKYANIHTPKGTLSSILRVRLQELATQRREPFNESIFETTQLQIDPLCEVQKIHKQMGSQQLSAIIKSTAKQYLKMTHYYTNKLFHSFSAQTVDFLIQQLYKCQSLSITEDLNIGHLTSYINMRTGKNLRNRFFYKFMKRINCRSNSANKNSFSSIIKKEDLKEALVRRGN